MHNQAVCLQAVYSGILLYTYICGVYYLSTRLVYRVTHKGSCDLDQRRHKLKKMKVPRVVYPFLDLANVYK